MAELGIKRSRGIAEEPARSSNSTSCYPMQFNCSRTLAAHAISHSFKKIARKLQLEIDESFPNGSQVHAVMPIPARDIFFFSAHLEVVQTIVTTGAHSAVVFLDWHHPVESSPDPISENGYRKRQKYISLFVQLWMSTLQKAQEYLCTNVDGILQDAEDKIKFELDRQHSVDLEDIEYVHENSASKPQVHFAPVDDLVEIPLTIEERDSRMAFGAVSTLPNGELKVLRPVSQTKVGLIQNETCRNHESPNCRVPEYEGAMEFDQPPLDPPEIKKRLRAF